MVQFKEAMTSFRSFPVELEKKKQACRKGPMICACQRSRNKVACGEYTRFINFSATSAEGTCNRFDPHPRPTDPFVSQVPTVPVPKRST